MLTLQRPPSCDHIIRLYDWFALKEHDIFVMEYPRPCITLFQFISRNRGRLNEKIARHIMFQLTVAARHCFDRGVHHETYLRRVLININTLQLKLVQFSHAQFITATGKLAFEDDLFIAVH